MHKETMRIAQFELRGRTFFTCPLNYGTQNKAYPNRALEYKLMYPGGCHTATFYATPVTWLWIEFALTHLNLFSGAIFQTDARASDVHIAFRTYPTSASLLWQNFRIKERIVHVENVRDSFQMASASKCIKVLHKNAFQCFPNSSYARWLGDDHD